MLHAISITLTRAEILEMARIKDPDLDAILTPLQGAKVNTIINTLPDGSLHIFAAQTEAEIDDV